MALKKGKNVVARTASVESRLVSRPWRTESNALKRRSRVTELMNSKSCSMRRRTDRSDLNKASLSLRERVARLERLEGEAKETQGVFESRLDKVESMLDQLKDETRRFDKELEMVRGSNACEAEVKALRIEVDKLKEELRSYKSVINGVRSQPSRRNIDPKYGSQVSKGLKCYFCDGPHLIRGCTEKNRLAAIVKAMDESTEGGVAKLGTKAVMRAA
ncbi:hypothetical protein V6N13_092879 [Hibiscus sabdariffa]